MKNFYIYVIIFCLFFTQGSGATDIYEPDNSPQQAVGIAVGNNGFGANDTEFSSYPQQHDFSDQNDDVDWVVFYAQPESQGYNFRVSSVDSNADPVLTLFNADNQQLWTRNAGGKGEDEVIPGNFENGDNNIDGDGWVAPFAGLYYLRINHIGGSNNITNSRYTLEIWNVHDNLAELRVAVADQCFQPESIGVDANDCNKPLPQLNLITKAELVIKGKTAPPLNDGTYKFRLYTSENKENGKNYVMKITADNYVERTVNINAKVNMCQRKIIFLQPSKGCNTTPKIENDSGQLINISTRVWISNDRGDNFHAHAGFHIKDARKRVLIRGVSPTVPGPLGDPYLRLFRLGTSNTLISEVDDWKNQANSNEIAALPSHLKPQNELDAALLLELDPGTYSVLLSPRDSSTPGIGLVSVDDLSPSEGGQLTNISTRAVVNNDSGDSFNAHAGLVIRGSRTRVLIRGVSPAIADALPDPYLKLYALGPINTLVGENDNWRNQNTGNEIAALPPHLVPQNDLDAALLLELEPGIYSVILSPRDSTKGGIGLVGIDKLDP